MSSLRSGACLSTGPFRLTHSRSLQRRADLGEDGVALLPQTHGNVLSVAAHADKSSKHAPMTSVDIDNEGSEPPTRQQRHLAASPRARKYERCEAQLA